jgi:hypothetical protein
MSAGDAAESASGNPAADQETESPVFHRHEKDEWEVLKPQLQPDTVDDVVVAGDSITDSINEDDDGLLLDSDSTASMAWNLWQ